MNTFFQTLSSTAVIPWISISYSHIESWVKTGVPEIPTISHLFPSPTDIPFSSKPHPDSRDYQLYFPAILLASTLEVPIRALFLKCLKSDRRKIYSHKRILGPVVLASVLTVITAKTMKMDMHKTANTIQNYMTAFFFQSGVCFEGSIVPIVCSANLYSSFIFPRLNQLPSNASILETFLNIDFNIAMRTWFPTLAFAISNQYLKKVPFVSRLSPIAACTAVVLSSYFLSGIQWQQTVTAVVTSKLGFFLLKNSSLFIHFLVHETTISKLAVRYVNMFEVRLSGRPSQPGTETIHLRLPSE